MEAGCFKGGGTAKISVAAAMTRRKLVVFDSFAGIPSNSEKHRNIWGSDISFNERDYCGGLEEVRENVGRFGELSVCTFVEGYFANTMPAFQTPVAAAYIDVDLASSTRTCLKYLYPLLQPGGFLFSQDGHLLPVLEVFLDARFWHEELGTAMPTIHGAGRKTIIWLRKPPQNETLRTDRLKSI